ncbi:chaperone modulator CbpM [Massilia sp. METH4]|uniref:chaperone modulator CbpM n=1 Tax=Massilia sp. METH4 TaxID=3123041 RepID=UPI0030CFEDE6
MNGKQPIRAVSLDETALTLDELARACAVDPGWVVHRVRTGILLGGTEAAPEAWRFTSVDLVRARSLLRIERDFDANEEVAALVVDLTEEVRRLRRRLRAAGL